MQISRERMKLVSRGVDEVFGAATSVRGSYLLAAFLRAIIIEKTEWTIESLEKNSSILVYKVRRESDLVMAFGADEYAFVICETADGYFPNDFSQAEWTALDGAPYPISRYLSSFAKTRVFVNDEKQRVVAVVDKMANARWVQGFVSTLPRVAKWYFTSGISEEDEAFLKTISVGNKAVSAEDAENAFLNYVNAAADKINLRFLALSKQLDGFEGRVRKARLESYRREIENIATSIVRYQDSMRELYTKLTSSQTVLKSLEETPVADSGELLKFFDTHKCLDVVYVDDDEIKFGITELLEYYDEDEFRTIYGRKGSYIHTRVSSSDIPAVMFAIFAEHKGAFVTNAVFSLTNMRYVSMHRELSKEDVLPHPHIYFFQCSGGNDQYYSKYADNGEWQLAIEQAIGATKNLNFGDSTVVGKMIEWLHLHRDTPCIKLTDSERVVSVKEFLKIIKKEN